MTCSAAAVDAYGLVTSLSIPFHPALALTLMLPGQLGPMRRDLLCRSSRCLRFSYFSIDIVTLGSSADLDAARTVEPDEV